MGMKHLRRRIIGIATGLALVAGFSATSGQAATAVETDTTTASANLLGVAAARRSWIGASA